MSEVWGCASSFGRSPKRDIGFVSFVRASGRGEAACLRERDYASLRWVINSRILLPSSFFFFCYTHESVFCWMHHFVCVCGFVCVCVRACVRASGRGEAACLRERDYASLRWVINSRVLLLLLLLRRLWNIVFCMGFIDFRFFLLICAWV